jgi:hypothetical protein
MEKGGRTEDETEVSKMVDQGVQEEAGMKSQRGYSREFFLNF